jgi:DMSO/TMAO reductase YedYZ molybdopterin-dependent catalytic subunit
VISSWNSGGPYVTYPGKSPLILLGDRPVLLETPRQHFDSPFTLNANFFVRWHLDKLPTSVNLSDWRLNLEGNVQKPLRFSMTDLISQFEPASIVAVNQCSGNSRFRFQPSVAGPQWGNGAMGNAVWTGVRLRDLLKVTRIRKNSLMVQFEGMEQCKIGAASNSKRYLKSLTLDDQILDECLVAYKMNEEQLPLLNGYPARLVVPGYFATYWVKALTSIRVLDRLDDNFWMGSAYRIPDTLRGDTTPKDIQRGAVRFVPIGRMPVRSFIVSPVEGNGVLCGRQVEIQGLAFSGYGRVVRVEVSSDDGTTWNDALLGEDNGAYSFRTWDLKWKPERPGTYVLSVRASDASGNIQPDVGVWNPGGYLWNKIERQEIVVGPAT